MFVGLNGIAVFLFFCDNDPVVGLVLDFNLAGLKPPPSVKFKV